MTPLSSCTHPLPFSIRMGPSASICAVREPVTGMFWVRRLCKSYTSTFTACRCAWSKELESKEGTPAFEGDALVAVKVDRKSTRLNSSHLVISYAVFCLKKKKK